MIKPVGTWIHIEVVKPEILGTLAIPDNARIEEEIVTVKTVGPDVTLCKPGDRIICRPQSGIQLPWGFTEDTIQDVDDIRKKMIYFCKESDIIAVSKAKED